MKVLLQLALNNIRKYKRESFLVIVSVALTISLITIAAALVSSLYASFVNGIVDTNPFNVQIHGVNNPKRFIEDINEKNLDYFEFEDNSEQAFIDSSNTNELGIIVGNFHAFDKNDNLPEYLTKRFELLNGRLSSSKDEIIVSRDSKTKIGDTIIISDVNGSYEAIVVGRSKYGMYYFTDDIIYDEKVDGSTRVTVSLVFKDGSKNIDSIVDDAMSKQKAENIYAEYNSDYNFLKGMQNKPGAQIYNFVFMGLILVLIISLMTFTLILNAFDTSFSQKDQTFSILRSVGTTKKQMRLMILFEGVILALLGIVLGLLIGTIMMNFLMTYLNDTIRSIDSLEYGVKDSIWLVYYFPKRLYFVIALASFMIVGLALIKKTHELYKRSAVEMNRTINIKKKKNLSIKRNPIFSMAKINNKLTYDMKGIKITLIISTIVLIVINSWLTTILYATNSVSTQYDTRIYSYEYGEGIEEDVAQILDAINNTKGINKILTSYESHDLAVDFSKYKLVDDNLIFNPHFTEGFEIVVIDDDSFEEVKRAHNMSDGQNTLLINSFKSFDEVSLQPNPDWVQLDINDGEYLNLNILSQGQAQNLEVKVDTVVSVLDESVEFVDPHRGSILMSQKYYDHNLSQILELKTVNIMLNTDMEIEDLKMFYSDIEALELNSEFDVYSDLEFQYVVKIIKTTTKIVSILLFSYIGFIILVNIINVTLTNFRKRKRDIAILRSIGAGVKDVKKMIFYETVLSVLKEWFIGALIGNILSVGLKMLFAMNLRDYAGMKLTLDSFSNLLSLLLSLIIVLIVMISIHFETKKLDIVEDVRAY